jgi:histidinol-phosphate phosphatase family protein
LIDFFMTQHTIPANHLPDIGKGWTLFLDRDGIINTDVIDDYIKNWEEFKFVNGCLDALKLLSPVFTYIFIVSNQRGVGRGLMTMDDLNLITENMLLKVEETGGRIDKAYYCTSTDSRNIDRKPNPGMALQAQRDFPEVDFKKSIMVGNMPGDMLFGRNIGAYTVFIPTRDDGVPDVGTVDAEYKDLLAFATELTALRQNTIILP